jgi:hypothetical protein
MLLHEYSIFVLSSLKILKGGIALYALHMHTQITLLKILPTASANTFIFIDNLRILRERVSE